ncbi:unnamed protein product [Caenorhabditis brenneri]
MSFDDKLKRMPPTGHRPKRPTEKIFVIREFLNVKGHLLEDGDTFVSKEEQYYNRMWSMVLKRTSTPDGPKLHLSLRCKRAPGTPKQSMVVEMTVKVRCHRFHRPKTVIQTKFKGTQWEELRGGVVLKWAELEMSDEEKSKMGSPRKPVPQEELRKQKLWGAMKKEQNVNRLPHVFTVRVRVLRTEMVLNLFSDAAPTSTLVKVGQEAFFVDKKKISNLSNWLKESFKAGHPNQLALRNNVDPADFQDFLFVATESEQLTDTTLESVLLLSSMFKTKELFIRCQEFLEEESELSLEKKFQLALQYGFEDFRNQCILKFRPSQQMTYSLPTYLQTVNSQALFVLWEEILIDYLKNKAEYDAYDDGEEGAEPMEGAEPAERAELSCIALSSSEDEKEKENETISLQCDNKESPEQAQIAVETA